MAHTLIRATLVGSAPYTAVIHQYPIVVMIHGAI